MRDTSSITNQKNAGFTLVEILVIAPLIVLMLAGFIALMINMTGDVMASAGRTRLMLAAQEMLETMKGDVERTVLFPAQSFTPTPPQGINYSAPADANGTSEPSYNGDQPFPTKYYHIIMRQIATTKNPLDPTRQIVYKKNSDGSCSTDPYFFDVVYFQTSKYIPATSTSEAFYAHRWWRRVVFDSATNNQPCTTPWQKPSCAAGQTAAICKATDEQWGSEGYTSGITIPSGWHVFYDVPDPRDTGTVPDGQAWIHPYNDGVSPCTANRPADIKTVTEECEFHRADPYSPTTGRNARAIVVSFALILDVGGRRVFYINNFIATRGGS
jgi:type II secretory pathway pseudopilin PulG